MKSNRIIRGILLGTYLSVIPIPMLGFAGIPFPFPWPWPPTTCDPTGTCPGTQTPA